MLDLIHGILHRTHFWRQIKLTELSELYISMTLKTFGISMIAVFVPVYLYQIGYSFGEISLYYAFYFTFKIPLNYLAGLLTARRGPKHTLAYSYVANLVYLSGLLTLPNYNWPLWAVAGLSSLAISLFFVAYHIDFSKIQDSAETGKELGNMYLLARVSAAVGPLLGGAVATWFGMHVTISLSILAILLAVWPLMMTNEPMATRGTLSFKGFSIKKNLRNMTAYGAVASPRQIGLTAWPLYISVFIFTNNVYGLVGLVTSVSIISSILVAKSIGNLIDNNKSRTLLNYSSIVVAVIHSLRIWVSSTLGVIGINFLSEFGETGVLLPLTKGFYDDADNAKDRIAYVVAYEQVIAASRALSWVVAAIAFLFFDARTVFYAMFGLAALVSPLVMVQNFKALKVQER